jgi:hypothetical protein
MAGNGYLTARSLGTPATDARAPRPLPDVAVSVRRRDGMSIELAKTGFDAIRKELLRRHEALVAGPPVQRSARNDELLTRIQNARWNARDEDTKPLLYVYRVDGEIEGFMKLYVKATHVFISDLGSFESGAGIGATLIGWALKLRGTVRLAVGPGVTDYYRGLGFVSGPQSSYVLNPSAGLAKTLWHKTTETGVYVKVSPPRARRNAIIGKLSPVKA